VRAGGTAHAVARGWAIAITGDLQLGDLVRVAPATLAVLARHGVDPRAGARSLADAARREGVALDALLAELRAAAAEDEARVDAYRAAGVI
jgi:iron-sulfur cluster repair protein YtfE (RIC family)